MSQVDELLNSMSVEELTVNPETEEHIIIGLDRRITVPDSLKRIAVQGDHNVETVTFDSPRYWDGRDLSELNIFINFVCANGRVGTYLVPSVHIDEVDPNIMHYDWVIKEEVTAAKGNLIFLVCAKSTDEEGMTLVHWNSERCSDMYVSEGLEVTDALFVQEPDILNRILLLTDITLTRAGVYVGSGDMPEWANVQVDPTGSAYPENSGGGTSVQSDSVFLYADEDNYLYATADTSDTSKRITKQELHDLTCSGVPIYMCFRYADAQWYSPAVTAFFTSYGGVYNTLTGNAYRTAEYTSET